MSDSFADLWNSSASTKPVPQPQRLGSVPTKNILKPARPDVFSLLSSAGSSNPSPRSMSPVITGETSQRTTSNSATKPLSNGGADAFSSLLSGSLAASTNGNTRMTMAERAAEAERQKLENVRRHTQTIKAPASNVWDGLDNLVMTGTQPVPSSPSEPRQGSFDDDWGLDAFASSQAGPAESTLPPIPVVTTEDDDWLGEFANKSALQQSQTLSLSDQSKSNIRDDDLLQPPLPSRRRTDSPRDFDFGDREDALLGDDSTDEDDILGALSRPVDALPQRQSPSTPVQDGSTLQSSSTTMGRTRTPSRPVPVSPPPHILGQIVEMGFSVQQARVALAATNTGIDVQAALEVLLANGAASGAPSAQLSSQLPDHNSVPRSTSRLMHHDREWSTTSPTASQQDIREQADKLLAHASEIGMNMFNKASSFWKEGKERVQKAYVEHAGVVGGSSNERPRWMMEQARHGDEDENSWQKTSRDPGARFFDEAELPSDKAKPHRQQLQQEKAPDLKPKPTATNLFSYNPQPIAYVSPFRRRTPVATGAAVSSPASTSRTHSPPRAVMRSSSPLRQRTNLVSASPSVLATAHKHKEAGSSKFRLGQYAEAEAAYTLGIGALPPGHLVLVPLHNNRALARLRTGDYSGAVADAGVVLNLIGAGYHPQCEAKVEKEDEGAGVDLGDALVKALKRRAEAWEGREKWEEAVKDWGVLAGLEWTGQKVRGEAARAVGRCRKMVAQNNGEMAPRPVTSKSKPRPSFRPASPSRPAVSSQALENLRTANDVAEAEDQLRHELKDSVDAKLLAWKGGKETNIRALLGSLDTILWPELGLQKVGMAELVMPAQVKIKYTRTIARLHPDKLNSSNTTVEQRMIANGVFGTLNEAWNAFKQ
ncbi:hypothetical protein C0995_009494 [Termitomyces sp. Mi166|nr:hypothetical protein C0995_009494 [Termitomyces sp. Mi166\